MPTTTWLSATAPQAVLLTAWGNAALSGHSSLDSAAEAISGELPHRLAGLAGEADEVSLAYGIGRLRALGAQRLRLVLPAPGDAAGLPGPPAFNAAALEAGAAVVSVGASLGLVPEVGRAVVRWTVDDVGVGGEGALPPLRDAERELDAAVRAAAEELGMLDVARWRPEVAEALTSLRSGSTLRFPPGHDPRAVRVAALAQRMLGVVTLARDDEGAAVSAAEMSLRSAALAPLERAARHAWSVAAGAQEDTRG